MTEFSINNDQLKALIESIDNGILDINEISHKNSEIKRDKILKGHPYSIYYQEKNNCWYTYLRDSTKKEKRRLLRRKNRKDLVDALVAFYSISKNEDTELNTLRNLYPKWLDYMAARSTASTTIIRYENDWRRWLDKDPIIDRPLITLDYITLDEWAHRVVKGNNAINQPMTKMQYYNTATVINGCLNYALEKHLIQENAFLRVRIDKKLFYKAEKPFKDDRDQVFNEEELPEVRKLALSDYTLNKDEVALAVFTIFYTALRAGEACALRWKSFNEDMTEIKINSQIVRDEKRDKNGNWKKVKWIMVNYTKSINGEREIYVPEKLREILIEHKKYKNPKSEDDMIFTRTDGTFINCTQTYRRTIKNSNKIQTYRKGTHKLRKTYLSVLYDGGIHESTLTKIAGQAIDGRVLHRYYLKDRKSQDEIRKKIDELI